MPLSLNYLRTTTLRLSALARKERQTQTPISWGRRLWLWRHGFLSRSDLFYDLTEETIKDYASEIFRAISTTSINYPHNHLLNDKLMFERMIGELAPSNHAWIKNGRVLPLRDDALTSAEALVTFCAEHPVVLKPIRGSYGHSILFVRRRDGGFEVNGEPIPDLKAFIRDLPGDMLVTELIEQAPYSAHIFPQTVNTIRALTMWDIDRREPFIARAVHRFGKTSSMPVDNWSSGSLSTMVDVETGRMGSAAYWRGGADLIRTGHHPETGAAIEGVLIPDWIETRDRLLALAARMPFLLYVGWDIVITPGGFRLIEGNGCTDLDLLQVHGPLLRDPRVRRFYDRYAGSP